MCVFITRSACTSCTLLSYICYRSNLSTKVCQQEVGHSTERERGSMACSTAHSTAPAWYPTSSHSTDIWNAQHSSLPKPLDWHTGWTGDHHPTTAGTGWLSWHWHHGCSVRLWCPSTEWIIPIGNAVLTNAAAVLADEPEDGHDASQHHARLQ